MGYVHYQFSADGGSVVRVDIDRQANVLLLDDINYQGYRSGRSFTYYGGLQLASPARIIVPRSGHWHVAIDLAGRSGNIRSSISVSS